MCIYVHIHIYVIWLILSMQLGLELPRRQTSGQAVERVSVMKRPTLNVVAEVPG